MMPFSGDAFSGDAFSGLASSAECARWNRAWIGDVLHDRRCGVFRFLYPHREDDEIVSYTAGIQD